MATAIFSGISAGIVIILALFGYVYAALVALAVSLVTGYIFYPGRSKKVDPAGKAVVITGCDSGFGNALAQRLDAMGFTVFAGCLFADREGARGLKEKCSDRLHTVQMDVTDDWQVRGVVKYVKENMTDSVLWAVVNNAGIAIFTEIEWCSVLQFQRIMDVNVFGVVRVTKAFLPLVRQVNGRIINVASLAGRFTMPAFAAYSMSKRACVAFSDALRIEMMKFNVDVITIEPGLYKTPIAEKSLLIEQNRRSWSDTPTEIKDVYGEEYFDAFIDNISVQMERAKSNVTEVVDLMVEATVVERPKIRYVPASSVVRAAILMYLPVQITDKLFKRAYQPKSGVKRSTGSSVSSESDHDGSHGNDVKQE